MKRIISAIVGVLVFAMSAVSFEAHAQSICANRSKIVDMLKNGYSEEPVFIGLTSNNSVIEVFASEKGTFTVIVTIPGGASCPVATGNEWQVQQPRKAEVKS